MVIPFDDIVSYCEKRLERVVLVGLLFFLGLYVISFGFKQIRPSKMTSEVDKVVQQVSVIASKSWPVSMRPERVDYVGNLKVTKSFEDYNELLSRNIFQPFVVSPTLERLVINPYELVEIVKKEVPLTWKGAMMKTNGTELFAQINTDSGQTHFVTPGDEVEGYEILDVNSVFVEVRRKGETKTKKLELNKRTLAEPLIAKIKDKETAKEILVRAEGGVDGWMVEDIDFTSKSVKMRKGKVVIYVKKGDE